MTVTYTGRVPNGSTFGCFWKVLGMSVLSRTSHTRNCDDIFDDKLSFNYHIEELTSSAFRELGFIVRRSRSFTIVLASQVLFHSLIRWRGSVYKLVWRELLAYLLVYYLINLLYRFGLNDFQKRSFEKIVVYFSQKTETVPMSFVLGFYVSLIVNRWWEQYKLLPWPDTLALFINAGIPGGDERQRLMRRNIVRYAVLAYVITLQRVSLRVKKRFPSWQHVVDCGLMMESEKKIFELMDSKTPMSKYWMPLVWATNIINRARKESLITSDHIVQTLLTELSDIRRRLGALIGYDTVCVPLVYTQVVTLALYIYFIGALLGRQFIADPLTSPSDNKGHNFEDMYFPFFLSIQFCFYVGWLKVAEVLINPFGEDDDDIELNWLIDRHIKQFFEYDWEAATPIRTSLRQGPEWHEDLMQASYMIVDEMHEEHPELLKDQYWEEVVPKDLPYTVASEHYRKEEPKGSAEEYKLKAHDGMYANLLSHKKSIVDDMYADYESVDTPITERRKSLNWFTRQLSRTGMGSIRSASTAYSSGGLFARHRGNSVYANPENGQLPPRPPHKEKMSIYDRLVGRKSSTRNKFGGKQGPKLNMASAMQVKNRPRIPTPDVTKEVMDREKNLASGMMHNQITTTGITMLPSQLHTAYPTYPPGDMPVVQVVLSPIQELDGSGSVNNTLHANQPGTAALAQAVLSPGLGPVLTTPVSVPMTVSQLNSLGFGSVSNSPLLGRTIQQNSFRNPAFIQAFEHHTPTPSIEAPISVDIPNPDENLQSTISSNSSDASDVSHVSKTSKITDVSNTSNTTASLKSKNSLEVDTANRESLSSEVQNPDTSGVSAPTSLTPGAALGEVRSRKTSTQSNGNTNSPKRGEVYV